jgi:dihydropteroate synthase
VPKERVEGTIATTVMGIIQGADIVRVHDVIENLRAAKVTDAVVRGWKSNG